MLNNVSLQLWWQQRRETNGGVKGKEKHQSGEHDCEQKYSLDGGGDVDDDGDDGDDDPDCEQKRSSDGGDDHSDCERKCLL